MASLLEGDGFDYVECLFVSDDVSDRRSSGLASNEVRSPAQTLAHLEARLQQGIGHFLLVGVTDSPCLDLPLSEGFCVAQVLKQARARWGPRPTLIADVGLSPYQPSGHSVVLADHGIDAQASYDAAARMAAVFIAAGADAVAPCLSLPLQTQAIRRHLDAAGLAGGEIIPYSTKFSSSLYGPYRSAIGSRLGSLRKSYQFDHDDVDRALAQLEHDLQQGASACIVKPALPYLDVLRDAARRSPRPVAVYHVSGEYMMAVLASDQGLLNGDDYFDEIHAAFQRCGARYVIGYAADHFLRWRSRSR